MYVVVKLLCERARRLLLKMHWNNCNNKSSFCLFIIRIAFKAEETMRWTVIPICDSFAWHKPHSLDCSAGRFLSWFLLLKMTVFSWTSFSAVFRRWMEKEKISNCHLLSNQSVSLSVCFILLFLWGRLVELSGISCTWEPSEWMTLQLDKERW